ncbi:MAG: inorganic diphosphatase [Candidatus Bathyarchaeota archaeon]|nr:inorganic diphosphatase [Candidatus Bathyarchaeota archaeon]
MNLWKKIPAGDKPPKFLNMVIEVVGGSRDKYQYDVMQEVLVLDRIIPSSVVFPVEYGFVPQTLSADGDPLDIMALSYEPLEVGAIARVRVIGALIIEDEEGIDPKILSVLVDDARFKGIEDASQIQKNKLIEIQEFFETYKRLEPHKWTKIKEWKNAEEAVKIVVKAIETYQKSEFAHNTKDINKDKVTEATKS